VQRCMRRNLFAFGRFHREWLNLDSKNSRNGNSPCVCLRNLVGNLRVVAVYIWCTRGILECPIVALVVGAVAVSVFVVGLSEPAIFAVNVAEMELVVEVIAGEIVEGVEIAFHNVVVIVEPTGIVAAGAMTGLAKIVASVVAYFLMSVFADRRFLPI